MRDGDIFMESVKRLKDSVFVRRIAPFSVIHIVNEISSSFHLNKVAKYFLGSPKSHIRNTLLFRNAFVDTVQLLLYYWSLNFQVIQ